MIQEERGIISGVIVSVLVRKENVHMNMCLIMNCYRECTNLQVKKSIVNGNKEIKITHSCLYSNFYLMLKYHSCYSLQNMLENPSVNLNALCNSCAKLACSSSS